MTHDVFVAASGVSLAGTLRIPAHSQGLVIFAHGSGSSRYSPRNRYVARELQKAGLATLLIDLLTPREEHVDERTATLRFDIPLLAGRLVAATDWAHAESRLRHLPVGYFGASTGAAAALMAAAERADLVHAVVSRGGRPDLAASHLEYVRAPTLLIVGGADTVVVELNRRAYTTLHRQAETRLDIIAGATHLFPERGALEAVAKLATSWFIRHLTQAGDQTVGAGTHSSIGR